VNTTVLLADDQSMVRAGFRMILESEPDIEVVGEAATGEQAAAATRRLHPDVVLMDIQMPLLDGIEATRRLRRVLPSVRIVLVSSSTSTVDRRRAREAGAFAAIAKGLGTDALVEAALAAAEAVAS
jgi:DNA-binding NarL/FixJ family response regulator